jgi:transcriptional regulator with XRE-family HTH domain
MPPQLGRRLKEAHGRAGLTQQALADRVGVQRVYIARAPENGAARRHHCRCGATFAKALKVNLVDLLR